MDIRHMSTFLLQVKKKELEDLWYYWTPLLQSYSGNLTHQPTICIPGTWMHSATRRSRDMFVVSRRFPLRTSGDVPSCDLVTLLRANEFPMSSITHIFAEWCMLHNLRTTHCQTKTRNQLAMYWPAFIAMLRFPTLARNVVETGCFRDVTFVVSWLENWCPLSWLLVGVFNLFETYANQIGSAPQVGVKIKNIWNHHQVIVASALLINFKLTTILEKTFHHHSYISCFRTQKSLLYSSEKAPPKNIPTNS